MPGKQIIHLHFMCWNDARMLPFFFRHYDKIVDKYFVHDNGSTDGSIALLEKHKRVELSHFDVSGDSFVDEARQPIGCGLGGFDPSRQQRSRDSHQVST